MEKSSFFNSINHDRTYKAEDWAEYFASFIGNGVFPVPANGLQVVVTSGMTVTVRAGKGWINGYFYINTDDLNIVLGTADGVLNRIDRIVLRWDLTERNIRVIVKPSPASAQPTAPTLQRDADAYEIALADVYIRAGSTAVQQADITDLRYNSELCGIVTGTVEQIDASVLTAQFNNFFALYRDLIAQEYNAYVSRVSGYEGDAEADYETFMQALQGFEEGASADFEAWFDGIKGQLSGDVAGKLTQDVQGLEGRVKALEDAAGSADPFTTEAWLGNAYLGSAYLSTVTE